MRRVLQIAGVSFLSLFSVAGLTALVDWSQRWEWFNEMMTSHPHLAAFIRTPGFYFVLLFLGLGILYLERKLKLPRILARWTNSRLVPNLHTTPMDAVFGSDEKRMDYPLDWFLFMEATIVNEAETPTTIRKLEATFRTGGGKRTVRALEDIQRFQKDMSFDSKCERHIPFEQPRYRGLLNFMRRIYGVPLTLGHAYDGWICFEIGNVSQREMNSSKLHAWLIDASGERYEIKCGKRDSVKWDKSFCILEHP